MFISEFMGTGVLMLLGVTGCACASLTGSKGKGLGYFGTQFLWGLAVWAGIYVAYKTGGHLNPSVTISKVIAHSLHSNVTLNGKVVGDGGISVTFVHVLMYILGQFAGAFVGAGLGWLVFRNQFNGPESDYVKRGCFVTQPEIRKFPSALLTEIVATFVLIAFVCVSGGTPTQTGAIPFAMVITAIGLSLGGPTGWALNAARDLSPRILYSLIPMKGKGTADWGYAWVPIVGPIVGSVIATYLMYALHLAVL
jgi:glycerol uptake facilitator protein